MVKQVPKKKGIIAKKFKISYYYFNSTNLIVSEMLSLCLVWAKPNIWLQWCAPNPLNMLVFFRLFVIIKVHLLQLANDVVTAIPKRVFFKLWCGWWRWFLRSTIWASLIRTQWWPERWFWRASQTPCLKHHNKPQTDQCLLGLIRNKKKNKRQNL